MANVGKKMRIHILHKLKVHYLCIKISWTVRYFNPLLPQICTHYTYNKYRPTAKKDAYIFIIYCLPIKRLTLIKINQTISYIVKIELIYRSSNIEIWEIMT